MRYCFLSIMILVSFSSYSQTVESFYKQSKEFNYKNVSTLHGQCYVPCGEQCVTVRDCQEKDITSHVRSSSSGELKIVGGYNNTYSKMSISQKSVDGAWSCSIELQNGKIRAVPNFFYD